MRDDFYGNSFVMLRVQDAYSQTGFILLTLLLFVFMIGLFTITLHHHLQLTLRTQQNYQQLLQQFYAVEAVLAHAEANLPLNEVSNTQQYKEKYDQYTIFYYFKRLPEPFCFHQQRAYFYRITAYLPNLLGYEVPLITLQTTYARLSTARCHGDEAILIHLGRSAWREYNH